MQQGPSTLLRRGHNMLVEVSTASVLVNSKLHINRESLPVWAHFDTGASSTTISEKLAQRSGRTRNHVGDGPLGSRLQGGLSYGG